ncbi:WXG100 family type VII secretion target [Kitasatospora sp. NPDC001660]
MSTYRVQMDQVEIIVGEMAAITRKINETLADLDNQSTVHLAEWTSAARDTYTQVKAQWDSAAADMTVKATNATQMLGTINEYYASGERSGVRLWS